MIPQVYFNGTDISVALSHPSFVRYEDFPKDPEVTFFMDMGSLFQLAYEDDITPIFRILEWLEANCRQGWRWTIDEKTEFVPDPTGKSILPNGKRASVSDVRRQLWINFDSRDDAMLSRITLVDLRNMRHANCGILSSGVS